MSRRRLTFVLAALLALGSLPAQAARLLLPRDRAVVGTDTLLVLGTAPRGSTVAWSIQGQGGADQGTAKADWGDLFEIFVLLDPGLNRISVAGETVQVFFNPGGLEAPTGFALLRVHGNDISRCRDCHDPLDLRLLDGGYPGVCLGCHLVVASNPAYKGNPAQDGHVRTAIADCGRCHEPHASTTPKLLRASSRELCGTCHRGKMAMEDTHPEHREGGCEACHDAHFSGYPNVLLDALPGLCQQCHDQGLAPVGGKPHPPLVEKQSCSLCHDSHGAGGNLLRGAAADPCRACHGAVLARGHRETLADCTSCHDPHGALGSGLLRPGVNRACGECHAGVAAGKTVHAALEEGCQVCHRPHRDRDRAGARAGCPRCHDLTAEGELASLHGDLALVPGTCVTCHPPHASDQNRLVRANLHFPLTQGKCSVCHGGGEDRSVVVQEVAKRCRMCHPFEREFRVRGDRLHDPVADGECTACHDPHMSNVPALLRDDQAQVCRSCHDLAEAGAGRALHPPARTCTDCHGAHGGEGPFFLNAAPPELCLECHDDPRRRPGEPHPALEEGCLVCHEPHAGFTPGLLRGASPAAVCLGCHDDPTGGEAVLHPVLKEGCSLCHEPHASQTEHFLRRRGNALCKGCHDLSGHHSLDTGRSAKYPGADRFPKDGKEFSCLGCHAAHASDQAMLFLRPKELLCRSCHEVAGR